MNAGKPHFTGNHWWTGLVLLALVIGNPAFVRADWDGSEPVAAPIIQVGDRWAFKVFDSVLGRARRVLASGER